MIFLVAWLVSLCAIWLIVQFSRVLAQAIIILLKATWIASLSVGNMLMPGERNKDNRENVLTAWRELKAAERDVELAQRQRDFAIRAHYGFRE